MGFGQEWPPFQGGSPSLGVPLQAKWILQCEVSQITEKGLILKSLLESVKSIRGVLKIEGGLSVGSRSASLDSMATCQLPCQLQERPWEE